MGFKEWIWITPMPSRFPDVDNLLSLASEVTFEYWHLRERSYSSEERPAWNVGFSDPHRRLAEETVFSMNTIDPRLRDE